MRSVDRIQSAVYTFPSLSTPDSGGLSKSVVSHSSGGGGGLSGYASPFLWGVRIGFSGTGGFLPAPGFRLLKSVFWGPSSLKLFSWLGGFGGGPWGFLVDDLLAIIGFSLNAETLTKYKFKVLSKMKYYEVIMRYY